MYSFFPSWSKRFRLKTPPPERVETPGLFSEDRPEGLGLTPFMGGSASPVGLMEPDLRQPRYDTDRGNFRNGPRPLANEPAIKMNRRTPRVLRGNIPDLSGDELSDTQVVVDLYEEPGRVTADFILPSGVNASNCLPSHTAGDDINVIVTADGQWFAAPNFLKTDDISVFIESTNRHNRLAKCQENAQSNGLISVKLLDSGGEETGDAFDVYVFPDGAETDFTSGYYLAHTGAIMAENDYIEVFKDVDGNWYMSSVLIKTQTVAAIVADARVDSRKIQAKYRLGLEVINAGTAYDGGNWQDLHEFVALAAKVLHEITVDGPNNKLYEDYTDGIYVFEKGTYDNDDDADNEIHTGSVCP